MFALQHVKIEKLPATQGFSLSEDISLPPAAGLTWNHHLGPGSSTVLPVTWQPTAAGPMAQPLSFKLDDKHRLQVKLIGTAAPRPAVDTAKRKQTADQRLRSVMQQANAAVAAAGSGPGARGTAASRAGKLREAVNGSSSSTMGPPAARKPAPAVARLANGKDISRGRTVASSASSTSSVSSATASSIRGDTKPAVGTDQTSFKLPPVRTKPVSTTLRLKPRVSSTSASAAAAVTGGGTTTGVQQQKGPGSPASSAGGSSKPRPFSGLQQQQRAGSALSTATSSRGSPVARSSSHRESKLGSTAAKARKTFSFFHTE